jgi:hypothetical protein
MTMTSEPVFAPARLALLLQHFAEINHDRESWRVAYKAFAETEFPSKSVKAIARTGS